MARVPPERLFFKERKNMKKTIVMKLACAIAAAALVLTTVPFINSSSPVTAEAKTKKTPNTKIVYMGGPFDKDSGIYPGKTDLQGDNLIIFSDFKANGKYTFTTNSKNLTIKMDTKTVKQIYGKSWTRYNDFITYHINAKKTGTYKVTIKEKYKGVTRTLKKNAKFYVVEPKVKKSATAYVGTFLNPDKLIENYSGSYYEFSIAEGENTVVEVAKDEYDSYSIKPIAEGTAKVNILDAYGKVYGETTVTVKTNYCASITYGGSATMDGGGYFEDENGNEVDGIEMDQYVDPEVDFPIDVSQYFTLHGIAEDDEEWGGDNFAITDKINITSADPSIVYVAYDAYNPDDPDDPDYKSWGAKGLKAGYTTLNVTCGDQTLTIPVHVRKSTSEDDDEDGE